MVIILMLDDDDDTAQKSSTTMSNGQQFFSEDVFPNAHCSAHEQSAQWDFPVPSHSTRVTVQPPVP